MMSKIKCFVLLIVVCFLLINNVQASREIKVRRDFCGSYTHIPFTPCTRREDCFEKCGGKPPYKNALCMPEHGKDRLCCCRNID
ncbi:unnamed protein product [Arabidopsis halleri]